MIGLTYCERFSDSVVLYLGDCFELLPGIGHVDACITDPPYGTGWIIGGGKKAGEFDSKVQGADWDIFNLDWLKLCSADLFAVFCPDGRIGDLMAVGGKRLRYYVKSNPRPPLGGRDAPSVEPIVIWPGVRFSKGPAHLVAYNGDAEHPAEKPLEIMTWLVRDLTMSDDLVLDPFMGSGTTGVASVRLRRGFVGIERDQKYYDIGRRRVGAAVEHMAKRAWFDQ